MLFLSKIFRPKSSTLSTFMVASSFVCAVSLSPAISLAQENSASSEDIERAASAYDEGREHYRAKEFNQAAEQFETADAYAPSAAALGLAIHARKQAGQLDRALTHAVLAMELYPENEKLVEEAQEVVDTYAPQFGEVHVTCDSDCGLRLNNRPVHGAPSGSRTIFVEAGEITLKASWSEGRARRETVTVREGQRREVDFYAPQVEAAVQEWDTEQTPPPVEEPIFEGPPEDEPAPTGRGGWHPAVFWTSLSLTAVAGGATIALGLNAKNNPGADYITKNCDQGDIDCEAFRKGRKNQTYATVAGVTTGIFGAFTVLSAVLTGWNKGTEESENEPGDVWSYQSGDISVRPVFEVGNGASLGATGTF